MTYPYNPYDHYPFAEEPAQRRRVALAGGPIRRVEVEVQGDTVAELVRAIAAGILKGLVDKKADFPIKGSRPCIQPIPLTLNKCIQGI